MPPFFVSISIGLVVLPLSFLSFKNICFNLMRTNARLRGCTYSVCMECPRTPEEGVESPGAVGTGGCEHPE